MRREAVLASLVVAFSAFALIIGVSRAAADVCSVNGSYETCVYWDPVYGTSATMPANSGWPSIHNYWFTNKMWRPTPNYALIYWTNSAPGTQDPFGCVNCNPLRRAGSWGYDRAWCVNNEPDSVPDTKCQVYNWNT